MTTIAVDFKNNVQSGEWLGAGYTLCERGPVHVHVNLTMTIRRKF